MSNATLEPEGSGKLMAEKPKKRTPGAITALARDRAPMVSLKTKKPKKTSRGK